MECEFERRENGLKVNDSQLVAICNESGVGEEHLDSNQVRGVAAVSVCHHGIGRVDGEITLVLHYVHCEGAQVVIVIASDRGGSLIAHNCGRVGRSRSLCQNGCCARRSEGARCQMMERTMVRFGHRD